jgi:hypothetical protein
VTTWDEINAELARLDAQTKEAVEFYGSTAVNAATAITAT